MDEFVDYYEVLQVHPKAEREVIEKAYKALMFKYHPDRGGTTERATLINLAYEELISPSRRADYNLTWAVMQSQSATPVASTPAMPEPIGSGPGAQAAAVGSVFALDAKMRAEYTKLFLKHKVRKRFVSVDRVHHEWLDDMTAYENKWRGQMDATWNREGWSVGSFGEGSDVVELLWNVYVTTLGVPCNAPGSPPNGWRGAADGMPVMP